MLSLRTGQYMYVKTKEIKNAGSVFKKIHEIK